MMKTPTFLSLLSGACALLLVSLSPLTAQEAPAPAQPSLDFGDYASSTLTSKAWAAYEAKNYEAAIAYADKCIESFKEEALKMQKSLTAVAPKEKAHDYWALNDVGTCYFIQAQSYEAQGKTKEALAAYQYLANNLSFAQCWDPQGWFWQPADAARKKVAALEFEAAQ